jgi:anti-anti-sigma regulatory factor
MSIFSLGSSLIRRPRPLRSDWFDEAPRPGVDLRFGPNAVLIRPKGPGVDTSDASEVLAAVREATTDRRQLRRFLIDLSGVEVPSSMAIGMLLELARLAEDAGATCHLHASNRFIEVLRMLRLDGRYTMVRDARRLDDLLR